MRKDSVFSLFIQLFVAVTLLTGIDQLTKFLAVENLKTRRYSFNFECIISSIFWKQEALPLVFSRKKISGAFNSLVLIGVSVMFYGKFRQIKIYLSKTSMFLITVLLKIH